MNTDGSLLWTSYFGLGEIPVYGGNTPVNPYNSSWSFKNSWKGLGEVAELVSTYYAEYNYPTGYGFDISIDELISSLDDDSYKNLPLGTKFVFPFKGELHCSRIIAKDADFSTTSGYYTKLTCSSAVTHPDRISMNTTENYSRWELSYARSLMQGYLPELPIELSNRIAEVEKYSFYASSTSGRNNETNDKIWLQSIREISPNTITRYETNGPTYSGFYTDNNKRIVYEPYISVGINSVNYWLRSKSTNTTAQCLYVSSTGSLPEVKPNASNICLTLGFCLD